MSVGSDGRGECCAAVRVCVCDVGWLGASVGGDHDGGRGWGCVPCRVRDDWWDQLRR